MLNKMANAYENTKILSAIVNSVSRDRSGNPHGKAVAWLSFDFPRGGMQLEKDIKLLNNKRNIR
jgi:hypothetical protein